ncbi:hypothetical protein L0Y81_30095 (plasmid) [Burkholderia multivorans]|uniref:hypothetical protein n=1 Tax=Burkholderia multivorans TaxID=87883 RepID=UPI0012D321B8|nr:hypothetical protein [Burkholderia multivorans]MBR8048171.1 hypothetical protein [Burkholderia multivorans]MBU9526017.1 hypothetical protein [Burkholderia multivorans]MCL4647408.1 hypothetical protein [Burkholderia multivorans]UQN90610.1 hypothetical protein L0Y85_30545 [Burkholderia multivorans]UQO75877.1 hypothetical protein L0Y81_30095 [Burkholderia multivorans]
MRMLATLVALATLGMGCLSFGLEIAQHLPHPASTFAAIASGTVVILLLVATRH